MQIASILGEEKKALAKLDQILLRSGCAENDRMDVKTAVAEACLNAIEHGNRFDAERSVNILIRVEAGTITIEVRDQGEGARLQPVPCEDKADINECRGWGLIFIDRLVDEWEYSYEPENRQFCVRMKKNFCKGGDQQQ